MDFGPRSAPNPPGHRFVLIKFKASASTLGRKKRELTQTSPSEVPICTLPRWTWVMSYKMIDQSKDLREIPCCCPGMFNYKLDACCWNENENLCRRQHDYAPLSLLFLRHWQILIWNEQLTKSTICLKPIWKLYYSLHWEYNTAMHNWLFS